MKSDLTKTQQDFLETLTIGKAVDISTSDYPVSHWVGGIGFSPVGRFTHQGLKSLMDKGYIEGEIFWRGATVTRIK